MSCINVNCATTPTKMAATFMRVIGLNRMGMLWFVRHAGRAIGTAGHRTRLLN